MVDGGGLENRWTRKGIGGSNPSPSAKLASLVSAEREGFRHRAAGGARRDGARIPDEMATHCARFSGASGLQAPRAGRRPSRRGTNPRRDGNSLRSFQRSEWASGTARGRRPSRRGTNPRRDGNSLRSFQRSEWASGTARGAAPVAPGHESQTRWQLTALVSAERVGFRHRAPGRRPSRRGTNPRRYGNSLRSSRRVGVQAPREEGR